MATIGTFRKTEDNSFTGEILTLGIAAHSVRIITEASRSNERAPSHRVLAGRAELGVGWAKLSSEGRSYIAVKLDDPSFAAPIFANLFADGHGDGYSLVWTRPGRKAE